MTGASLQTDAGVGDDLLPDLGFAGDVVRGLGLVLAIVSMPCWPYAACTSGALSAFVMMAFSVATISGGTLDDTTTAYQLVAA